MEHPGRRRHALLTRSPLWGAALLAAALAACGCFLDPREAEAPAVQPPVDFEQPVSPDIVLRNIESGLEAEWVENYRLSFKTGELIMEMDSGEFADAGVNENPFTDWTRELDAQRMVQVINSMNSADEEVELDIEWDPDAESKWRGDENWYDDLTYKLTFTGEGETVTYAGRVDLYFVEESSLWYISEWHDLTDGSGNRSWCFLRHKQTWNPGG